MNTKLRQFNRWSHEFLIEAAQLLALIGFISGTVDVFSGGGLAQNGIFNIVWSIIQAVALDGLFFAVWLQVKPAYGVRRYSLIGTGVLLGVVLFIINGVLSLQSVLHISSENAMMMFGLNLVLFTYLRAGLVIVVSVLSILVLQNSEHVTEQKNEQEVVTEQVPNIIEQPTKEMVLVTEQEPLQIKQYTNKKDHILTLQNEHPEWTNKQFVDATGYSKSFVSTTLRKAV